MKKLYLRSAAFVLSLVLAGALFPLQGIAAEPAAGSEPAAPLTEQISEALPTAEPNLPEMPQAEDSGTVAMEVTTEMEPAENTKKPENVKWGKNYSIEFDLAWGNDEVCYGVDLYLGDEQIKSNVIMSISRDEHVSIELAEYINESGNYRVDVYAAYRYYDDEIGGWKFNHGPKVASEVKTYAHPGKKMAHPTNLRWEYDWDCAKAVWDEPGGTVPEDTIACEIYNKIGEDNYKYYTGSHYLQHLDESWMPVEPPAGDYVFKIKMVSSRLDEIGNGGYTEYSPVMNLKSTGGSAEKMLKYLIDNKDTLAADDIQKNMSMMTKNIIAQSLMYKKELAQGFFVLENQYMTEKSITTETVTDSTAGSLIDKANVSVVGAGFNTASANQKVEVHLKNPANPAPLDTSKYSSSIQVEIGLSTVGSGKIFDVPIKVTMPVPAGLNDFTENFYCKGEKDNSIYYEYLSSDRNMICFAIKEPTIISFEVFKKQDNSSTPAPSESQPSISSSSKAPAPSSKSSSSNNGQTEKIGVSSVTLNMQAKVMQVKGKVKLKATVLPSNATDKKVVWASSNRKVASVNSSGQVTAIKEGKATITAKAGGKSVKCQITVSSKAKAVKGLKLNKSSLSFKKGGKYSLKATVSPSDASNKKVAYTSSNKKVATVNSRGQVKAVGKGRATITVTTSDGGFKKTCKIVVK